MGVPWSHITPEEAKINKELNIMNSYGTGPFSYRGISKDEYEDDYNEKIIYCKVHKLSGIGGCIACEEEEMIEEESNDE